MKGKDIGLIHHQVIQKVSMGDETVCLMIEQEVEAQHYVPLNVYTSRVCPPGRILRRLRARSNGGKSSSSLADLKLVSVSCTAK
jgi:hypothetical protein